jgi:CheY-like chemotaxis protein
MSRYSLVLIIDDSEMDNFLNKTILETMNYCDKVITYTNPANALQYLKSTIQENNPSQIPNLVFLDINMPLMTGFEFLDEFLKLPQELLSGVKFYMISSSEDPEDVEKTKKYKQIIKYLNKPLDKNELN